jgi:mannosyltransferase OCH1-like enzyme
MYSTKDISELPEKWRKAHQSCVDQIRESPHKYVHLIWTDETMDAFMSKHFPEVFFSEYSGRTSPITNQTLPGGKYRFQIQRFDAFRYYVLYIMGGMYLDMDIGCKNPIDDLFWINGAVLPLTEPFGLSNDFMMAPSQHPFFR